MTILTTRQQDTLSYTGIFGTLLSAACVVQNLMYFRTFDHWIPALMLLVFAFTAYAFIALATQKYFAPLLLIISAASVIVTEFVLAVKFVYSLIVLLLFIYNATIVIWLFIQQYPALLKNKAMALREEEDKWNGVL